MTVRKATRALQADQVPDNGPPSCSAHVGVACDMSAIIGLALWAGMADSDTGRVIDVVRKFFRRPRQGRSRRALTVD